MEAEEADAVPVPEGIIAEAISEDMDMDIDMEDWAMALLARARVEMTAGMYILGVKYGIILKCGRRKKVVYVIG